MYKNKIKRIIDFIMALGGLIVLSPVFIILCIWIKLDSKGPILFKQKRIGINKSYFNIYKFRTMYVDTPKDMPTHMLSNPDQYITKSGKFLRKTSLDELPQILNILKGEMAVIGPRPALWNQDDLIAERDKYHANDVRPGLTGWAQINGRDELEIPVKAKLDGEYVEKESFFMDVKCFLGTIGSVLVGDGVVEGGTGEMEKASQVTSPEKLNKEIMIGAGVVAGAGTVGLGLLGLIVHKFKNKDKKEKKKVSLKKALFILTSFYAVVTAIVNIFRKKNLNIKPKENKEQTDNDEDIKEKNILITGAHSYIGESVEKWLKDKSNNYSVETFDMLDPKWKEHDFSKYDVVYHVAGIAHADVGNVSDEVKEKYYKVNRDLALEVASKAKENGVKQFIFMSSMIIYSGCKETFITKDTVPQAENFYGDSKLQADQALQKLNDKKFKVCIVRPPMIYGKGSKGNYPVLVKLATKLPVFPIVKNRRSMLHIDNLCEFIRLMIDNEEAGIFFPQNDEYTNTSDMVEMIAKVKGHKIIMLPGTNAIIKLMTKVPGKVGTLANKAFGSSAYDMILSYYDKGDYRVRSLNESIQVSENFNYKREKKAIIIASVASMIDQFNRDNINILQELGYEVHVACNFENAGTITTERTEKLKKDLDDLDVKYYQVSIPRKINDIKSLINSYKTLKKLANDGQYTLMHCHSPIGGVLARLSFNECRKKKITKVIYTAHGFHFFKGAPLKNWIIFYPIEKYCARMTDILITINKDDFKFAKEHMKSTQVEYVPGIGIDLEKFKLENFDRNDYRIKLGINANDFMILSVGELNKNKNHEIIIRAIASLNNSNIHYFIAGQGELKEYLTLLSKELNVENQVHLLGYRNDIVQLCNSADLYILPSIREGLNVSLMEAMASGIPCIVSDIRGNRDLIYNNQNGFLCNPLKEEEFKKDINEIRNNIDVSNLFQKSELKTIQNFSNIKVKKIMDEIYKEGTNI